MKLSKRLQSIGDMIIDHYHHIWDCCCDHGLLGMSLLKRRLGDQIHFVDIVPDITEELTQNLDKLFPEVGLEKGWMVHCLDLVNLPISRADLKQKHLVIIAGVGGEQTVEMVQTLNERFPHVAMEFLLCPIRQQFQLRTALKSMGFGLVDEGLVRDNGRFYEIIHVAQNRKTPLGNVGSKMWKTSKGQGQLYLNQILAHYERKAQSTAGDAASIFAAYTVLRDELGLVSGLGIEETHNVL